MGQGRRYRSRYQPTAHQGNSDYGKQAAGIFPYIRFGKGDGHKADAGNHSPGQQRPGATFKGKRAGPDPTPSLIDLGFNHFHHDHGIIHQHPKRNNQSAEGQLM